MERNAAHASGLAALLALLLTLSAPLAAAGEHAAEAGAPPPEAASEGPLARLERERLAALAASGLERRTLETTAGRLVYWQGGEGRPLVLLHGSGDSAARWSVVVPQLLGDHRLLIPDLAGHGASEPAAGVLPMATLLAGLEELLDAAELEEPVVAGNSMGAWLAMLYAHRHPARVARVVAINGGAILGEPSTLNLTPTDREQARTLMAALRDPSSPPIPDELLDDLVARSAASPIRRMMLDLPGMMGHLLDGKLSEITVPVDLLWGESDGLMKTSYAERMAAGLPRARVTLIPKCGHIPMTECPERFVALLREILSREPPPAAVEPEPAAEPPGAATGAEEGEGAGEGLAPSRAASETATRTAAHRP